MDERLLRLYENELRFLRELGDEFASEYPQMAAHLGMRPHQTGDPSVERLLEGVSFLTARVQLQLQSEFPHFTENLLGLMHPDSVAPVPSMAIVQFSPDLAEKRLAQGFTVPPGTVLHTVAPQSQPCRFSTHDAVTLWPIGIEHVELTSDVLLPVGQAAEAAGVLSVRLRATAGLRFSQIQLDELPLHVLGNDHTASAVYEALTCHAMGVWVGSGDTAAPSVFLPRDHVVPSGFAAAPMAHCHNAPPDASPHGLLKRFLAFPAGCRFVTIKGLKDALASCHGSVIALRIPLREVAFPSSASLDQRSLALFCTTATNRFQRRSDRVWIDHWTQEYPIVVDRLRPADHEVLEVLSVAGHMAGFDAPLHGYPIYAPTPDSERREGSGFGYHTRRTPGHVQHAGGVSYVKSELSIALAPSALLTRTDRRMQLSLEVLCSNGAWPLTLPWGQGDTDFALDIAGPVKAVRCLVGPSAPIAGPAVGKEAWQCIRRIAHDYLPLAHDDGEQGACALRDLLQALVPQPTVATQRLINGITSVQAVPITKRWGVGGNVTSIRGYRVSLVLNEAACEGVGLALCGAVLHRFFERYATINACLEVELRGDRRGRIVTWAAREGEWMIL